MAFKTPEASTSFLLLNETATEYKPKFPTGTKNGYLVLCSFLVFGTGRTYTATGWTQLGTAQTITGGQYVSFYRVATKADEEGVGTTTYPIKISGTAVSGTWATTWVKNVNATTPVVGGENKAALASTTVKWPTATPTEVPCLDMLVVQGVAEDTFALPSGFTALATGTSLFHSFSRTYETKAATGETSTTQTTSTPVGTTRILILGEEESGTTPAVITPSPTGGIGAAALALSAPSLIGLSASGVGTAGVSLNAPTKIMPSVSAGVATAGLKLSAPTRITPSVSAGVGGATLLLSRPQPVVPSAAAGVGGAALALTAPTLLPLSPIAGVGSAALALEIPSSGVNLPLQPTGGVGAAALGLTVAAKLALSSQGVGTGSLAITAAPRLVLAASGEGAAAAALTARPLLALLAAGAGEAALAIHAPTVIAASSAGVATAGLVIATPGSAALVLSPTGGVGSASLALTVATRLGTLLAAGQGSAGASLLTAAQIAPRAEGVGAALLALKVTPRLTLVTGGEGRASLVISTKVFLALMASGEGRAMLALSVLAVVGYGTAVLSSTPLGSAGLIVTAADGDAAALPLGSAAVGATRLGSAILAGAHGSATLVVKP